MKKTNLFLNIAALSTILFACSGSKESSLSNMVATVQIDEPIEGICDNNNVLMLMPFLNKNQVKAVPPMTDEELAQRINNTLPFLKENPNHNDKGMVGVMVNCKGEMVQAKIDNKTSSPELDQQILSVFQEMKTWKAGTYYGKGVDSHNLYSFDIVDGVLSF